LSARGGLAWSLHHSLLPGDQLEHAGGSEVAPLHVHTTPPPPHDSRLDDHSIVEPRIEGSQPQAHAIARSQPVCCREIRAASAHIAQATEAFLLTAMLDANDLVHAQARL